MLRCQRARFDDWRVATIMLTFYDEIRAGDAEGVLSRLNAEPNAAVEVRINSPGGSVTEGLAIYNALKSRAPMVYIDGVAASIASLIAMAGTQVIAAANALVMVHDPWVGTEGNADALRRTADALDKHRDAMLQAYARTGLPRQELTNLLAAETWMNADEARALGFVDEIREALPYAAHARTCFASYHNVPMELLDMSTVHTAARAAATPAPAPSTPTAPGAPNLSSGAPTPDDLAAAIKRGLAADPVAAAATDAILAALADRNTQISAMVQPYLDRTPIRDCALKALADPRVTLDDFRVEVLRLLGRDTTPCGGAVGRVSGGNGAGDFVAAASDALAIRAGVKLTKMHPGAQDVQGMTLMDIARASMSRAGRGFDTATQSRGALIKAAMTTSDFPAILENTLNKSLRTGFEAEPKTFEAWSRGVTVTDFKPQSRVTLGSAPDLLQVPEGGEYQAGSMDDDKAVPYVVTKFGRVVLLTWEALVNDDLSAFGRITQAMGQAAARVEADQVYATFAENSGAGPKMQDGTNLFTSGHANLAASAADVTADALSAARVLLRRQTAVGGGVMNITPRYLLVAPEQEQAAETLLAAAARGLSQTSNVELMPAWLAQLELVVEARLPDTAFYLLASPANIDTLEYAHLDADGGPASEEDTDFLTDARRYKIRDVFGQRWLDWRGAVKVPLT